ncbi:unnamed protein product [Parajaminaea phylloscopi]
MPSVLRSGRVASTGRKKRAARSLTPPRAKGRTTRATATISKTRAASKLSAAQRQRRAPRESSSSSSEEDGESSGSSAEVAQRRSLPSRNTRSRVSASAKVARRPQAPRNLATRRQAQRKSRSAAVRESSGSEQDESDSDAASEQAASSDRIRLDSGDESGSANSDEDDVDMSEAKADSEEGSQSAQSSGNESDLSDIPQRRAARQLAASQAQRSASSDTDSEEGSSGAPTRRFSNRTSRRSVAVADTGRTARTRPRRSTASRARRPQAALEDSDSTDDDDGSSSGSGNVRNDRKRPVRGAAAKTLASLRPKSEDLSDNESSSASSSRSFLSAKSASEDSALLAASPQPSGSEAAGDSDSSQEGHFRRALQARALPHDSRANKRRSDRASPPRPTRNVGRRRKPRERLHITDGVGDESEQEEDATDPSEATSDASDEFRSRIPRPARNVRLPRSRKTRTSKRSEDSFSDSDDSVSSSSTDSAVSSSADIDTEDSVETASDFDVEPGDLPGLGSVRLTAMTEAQRAQYTQGVESAHESSSESASLEGEASETVFTSRGRPVRKRRRMGLVEESTVSVGASQAGARRERMQSAAPESDAGSISNSEIEEDRPSAVERHFDVCYRCWERPGWQQLSELKRSQTTLRLKKRKLKRAIKREQRAVQHKFETREHRKGVHYREGEFEELHALGIARRRYADRLLNLGVKGAWLRCSTCTAAIHTGCLPEPQGARLLQVINAEAQSRHRVLHLPGPSPKPKATWKPSDVVHGVQCSLCAQSDWACLHCNARCITEPEPSDDNVPLAFRCKRCFRVAHYNCIQQVTGLDTLDEVAASRQLADWKCVDCDTWGEVDVILAWRPAHSMVEGQEAESRASWQAPHKASEDLPRDYLVKFKHTSFSETQWVPHIWLRSTYYISLRRFLAHGSKLDLDPSPIDAFNKTKGPNDAAQPSQVDGEQADQRAAKPRQSAAALHFEQEKQRRRSKRLQLALTLSRETGEVMRGPPPPAPDAQQRIPKTWTTPDRVLDAYLSLSTLSTSDLADVIEGTVFHRRPRSITKIGEGAGISARKDRLEQSTEHIHISQVNQDVLDNMSDGRILDLMQGSKVLVKWEDLEYEQSTWEDGASQMTHAAQWRAFVGAFRKYIRSRNVYVKHLTERDFIQLERERQRTKFKAIEKQPSYVTGGTMLDFQLEGLNWLRWGWHNHQPGILADEMGLGKTIQVISFIAALHRQFDGLAPYLVVVPNSVVTNWVREFDHWCPHLRVVPYFGGRESRGIIERFEMFHLESVKGRQDLRAEVIVCSDTTVRLDPAPLRRIQQWQLLVVDEGTNLKAGASTLIYKRLASLNAAHRLIMTGTPLNNNIGELFNLLNWLKPNAEWKDVKSLRAKYDALTPDLIAEIQPMLKPYILRRLKKDVVNLPARSEILVPVSLTPLQKRVYKDVLERNVEDIQSLTDARGRRETKYNIGNLLNILVQLRKVCQHPYLIAPTLENFGGPGFDWKLEATRLVEASSKLILLQKLLPQLKARGHRVLIFSQFVIYLDIIESFLLNEGTYKYLRLDGSVGHRQRQQGISQFNSPGSDVFCYLISTRAGGVGINLASADTVIILDSDFNPHLDMQAIARAHRIGQKRKVLVFTLVTKDTAEERIVESARKKLILDHVIQATDDVDAQPESLQDILRFGARALFQRGGTEHSSRDVKITDADVARLIDECEQGEDVTQQAGAGASLLSFAKVWDKEEETDPTAQMAEESFWADLLERTRQQDPAEDQDAENVQYGRGGARKAKLQARQSGVSSQQPNVQDFGEYDGPSFDQDIDQATVSTMPDMPGVGPLSLGPVKRKRGRPSKKDLAERAAQQALLNAGTSHEETPSGSHPLSSAFANVARRLQPAPAPPKEKKQRAPRKPRKKKGDAAAGADSSLATAQTTQASQGNASDPGAIYHAIAQLTDPQAARELARSAFPTQPPLAEALYMAWQDVILKRGMGEQPQNRRGHAAAASFRGAGNQAVFGTGSASSSGPPITLGSAPVSTLAGALGPVSDRTADATRDAAAKAAPKKPRAPRVRKTQVQAPDVSADSPSVGSQPETAPRPRARPTVSAARRKAMIEAATQRAAAGTTDTSGPSTSSASLATQNAPSQSAADPATRPQPQWTAQAAQDMLKGLPADFMEEVQKRLAQGPPPPLIASELRTQLTTTHMAYFSLRILQYLQGVHPLFHEAFTLVQPDMLPPALKKEPFEGAERLKMSIVQDRLYDAAHFFLAQSTASTAESPIGNPPTDPTPTPKRGRGQRKPATQPRKPRAPKKKTAPPAQAAADPAGPSAVHVNTASVTHAQHPYERPTPAVREQSSLSAAMGHHHPQPPVLPPPTSLLSLAPSAPSPRSGSSRQRRTGEANESGQPRFYDNVLNDNNTAHRGASSNLGSSSRHAADPLSTSTGQIRDNTWRGGQGRQQSSSYAAPAASHSFESLRASESHFYGHSGSYDGSSSLIHGPAPSTPSLDAAVFSDVGSRPIPSNAHPPRSASRHEALAFYWLQAIDMLELPGLSKAARMWLLQTPGEPQRDVMGAQINSTLAQVLDERRRLGQPVPDFFQ